MPTDTEILNWLLKNVNYLEHHADTDHPFNFWPHEEAEGLVFQEDKLGLSLREYVVARIGEEK